MTDRVGDYLCGTELSLADASVFASMVFFDFMIPQFFGGRREEYMGPRMLKWWSFMCSSVPAAQALKAEMEEPLNGWKSKGRWDPIIEEMKQVNA